MSRLILLLTLTAGGLAFACGCAVHRSDIHRWYFYDGATGRPIDGVLLLDWTEKATPSSPEMGGFSQVVPAPGTLVDVHAAGLTLANPVYHPGDKTSMMGSREQSRFMAVRPPYGYKVVFANPERMSRLGVRDASDASAAHIVLSHEVDPSVAADWLEWLANGRDALPGRLSATQRRQLYQAFAAYWERTAAQRGPSLSAELDARPKSAFAELARIYREEIGKPAPKLPSQ